jgi:hypothetical protein
MILVTTGSSKLPLLTNSAANADGALAKPDKNSISAVVNIDVLITFLATKLSMRRFMPQWFASLPELG